MTGGMLPQQCDMIDLIDLCRARRKRPRQDILLDYKRILEKIYDPVACSGRLERLASMLDNSGRRRQTRASDSRHGLSGSEMLHRIITNLPEPRDTFHRTFTRCISTNPRAARWIVALMALYLHLGRGAGIRTEINRVRPRLHR
jgi:hypothetical protein